VQFVSVFDDKVSAISGKATFVSANEIRVVTPPFDAAAQVKISVSLNDGNDFCLPAADIFQYYEQPDFREVVPHLGPRLGETPVILLGDGFINLRGVARCKFGDKTSNAFFDDSAATPFLRCITPPSSLPTWVNVEVALDGQVFTSIKTTKFQYYGEFDVTGLAPLGGPTAGGTVVTVTGAGFFMSGNYMRCFFGDGLSECSVDVSYPCYLASPAKYVSPTMVTCPTPPIPPGGAVTERYPVRMGLNGQFSQACPSVQTGLACPLKAGLSFTYYNDVSITSITPNSGQVQGGTRVTITGTNFRSDLEGRTLCMFTLCTIDDVHMSGILFGTFKDPTRVECSGDTVTSRATAIIGTNSLVCQTPLAASADSHFALVDISLNDGATRQRKYGPTCPNGCPVTYFFYSLPLIGTLSPNLGPEAGGAVAWSCPCPVFPSVNCAGSNSTYIHILYV
jgi:hypothetical protein